MGAMDDAPAMPGFTNDDRLTYIVGLIAREAVRLDTAAVQLFGSLLRDAEIARTLVPRETTRTLRQCRDLLGTAHLSSSQMSRAVEILKSAEQSYGERNRYIHASLLADRDGRLFRWRPHTAADEHTMEHAELALESLIRSTWRVKALRGLVIGYDEDWQALSDNQFEIIGTGMVSYIEPDD